MLKRAGGDDELIADLRVWALSPRFDAAEKAALQLAESMTARPKAGIDPDLWATLRAQYDEGQVVELVACIAAFNAFNRMVNALQIEITR